MAKAGRTRGATHVHAKNTDPGHLGHRSHDFGLPKNRQKLQIRGHAGCPRGRAGSQPCPGEKGTKADAG